jgi:hypothetical protein
MTASDSQCRQFARVDPSHHIFVSNGLQVNHCGSQVFVSHPILQGLYVADVILQVARRKRVPKFVKEEIGAVRPFRALVSVLRNASATIQFGVKGDAL